MIKRFMVGNICEDNFHARKVVILEAAYKGVGLVNDIPPRVVINDNYILEGDEGTQALSELYYLDHFSYGEYNHMRTRYQQMLDSYDMSKGKMPAVIRNLS